jgi:hypothetical protein
MIGTTQLHQRFAGHGLNRRQVLEKAYLIQESLARALALTSRPIPNSSRLLTPAESLRRVVNREAQLLWMRWVAVVNDEEIQDGPLSKMEKQAMELNTSFNAWIEIGGHLE